MFQQPELTHTDNPRVNSLPHVPTAGLPARHIVWRKPTVPQAPTLLVSDAFSRCSGLFGICIRGFLLNQRRHSVPRTQDAMLLTDETLLVHGEPARESSQKQFLLRSIAKLRDLRKESWVNARKPITSK